MPQWGCGVGRTETCAAGTESAGGRDREAGSGCDAVGEVDSAPAGSFEQPPPVRLLNGVPSSGRPPVCLMRIPVQ